MTPVIIDIQDAAKSSPNHETQSPEVTSKAICKEEDIDDDLPKQEEINDSVKSLSERLSAAKEDLVKQHAKVAEEAIAGRIGQIKFVHVVPPQTFSYAKWNLMNELNGFIELSLWHFFFQDLTEF